MAAPLQSNRFWILAIRGIFKKLAMDHDWRSPIEANADRKDRNCILHTLRCVIIIGDAKFCI